MRSDFKIESPRNLRIDLKTLKLIVPSLFTILEDEDTRRSYKDNIAMSFMDTFYQQVVIDKDGFVTVGYAEVHKIANDAADHFLKLLLGEYE